MFSKILKFPNFRVKFTYYYNILYGMDMSVSCANCGRKTQDYPIFCYMCDDYYCSEHCHSEKHSLQYKKH